MRVSIPFIAGQWSLLAITGKIDGLSVSFQSPSLRGSGRFLRPGAARGARRGVSIPFIAGQWSLQAFLLARLTRFDLCFNPLHCGAVVASRHIRRSPAGGEHVSIPFIAGQWSLRVDDIFRAIYEGLVSIPFIAGQWSLLPPPKGGAIRLHVLVSIPFIAGQWSLPARRAPGARGGDVFQSPSLRGSGRFPLDPDLQAVRLSLFQSPSLRGSGRFLAALAAWRRAAEAFQSPSLRGSGRFRPLGLQAWDRSAQVSIPFIAGQWSLRNIVDQDPDLAAVFQSPSLRGSGRFRPPGSSDPEPTRSFNPLHCGAVVASRRRDKNFHFLLLVSIPFIAGQWSLPVAATLYAAGAAGVSIPFIAGQWSLHIAADAGIEIA